MVKIIGQCLRTETFFKEIADKIMVKKKYIV